MGRNRNINNMFTKIIVDVGVNEVDIAFKIDVTPRTVSNWMKEPRNISMNHLESLCQFLGVDVGSIGSSSTM